MEEALLVLLKNAAEAIKAAIELIESEEQCPHPETKRIDMSAMGKIHWLCKECGYEHMEEVK